MDIQLPDVDELIKMANEDPEGLEKLREKLCRQLIENAPKQYQRRLNGLQFQINMERRRSNNPLHSCIKISQMMMESYQSLQIALSELSLLQEDEKNQATHILTDENTNICRENSADIIEFNRVIK